MSATVHQDAEVRRGAFSSRRVFMLAAIGSAVGLGNIWRFPYVAYENGGGAFVIPYLVALLTAGIPFLFLDYALGHRNRGSAPLSFARMGRGAEGLGWWQVGICFMIAVYYMVMGVQKGIGATSVVFIPILVLAFAALVVRALFLPGAADGLDALFTPNWDALTSTSVWAAAFGQIFFSLSVGFGIMITYASYVHRDTDMTGSGLVVGFANSSFELLAGIGVFAALGFMAQANGVAVDEVATDGLGLAFIAFPTIISEAPAGALIGVLFFASLVLAGLTSLISVIEVVVSAVRDKFEMTRRNAALAVTVPSAILSLLFFSTTSGVYVLDIVDNFINRFGILLVAVVSMVVVVWVLRALPTLANHMNRNGSIHLGLWWVVLMSVITPLALTYILVQDFIDHLDEPYGGYPNWMLLVFGWGAAAAVIVFGFVAARMRWRDDNALTVPEEGKRP
jgi:NSS family neurotransmitter:Na+ symporter